MNGQQGRVMRRNLMGKRIVSLAAILILASVHLAKAQQPTGKV
jgi:hypothetical protein